MRQKTGLLSAITRFLASIKLTVFIFFVLAVCSVVGTLLPQGLTLEEMRRHFSSSASWWIQTFSLHDIYHALWFQSLLLLLSLNLVVCSLDRLPKTIKLIRHRDDQINPDKLSKFQQNRQLFCRLPFEEAVARTTALVSRDFSPLERLTSESGFGGVAQKGRWSRMMVYLVHASVLLILIGAILGSVFGFKGYMQLAEGESSSGVQLMKDMRTLTLPFEVRCDKFDVSFYDTGMPREFRSDLTILADGRESLKQSVWVNDPLTFEGVTFYQSSYGTALHQAEVEFKDRDSGKVHRISMPFRETMFIPETEDRVQVVEYQKDFRTLGPALGIALLKKGQESTGSWIIVDRPDFHGNRIQNYQVRVIKADTGFYTGLQVKKDPGVWVVYLGFIAMLTGIGLCFYTSHRRVWVCIESNPAGREKTKIVIAGRTNRHPFAFEKDFARLCEGLQAALTKNEA